MAYDQLRKTQPGKCSKKYLQILHLAATELEADVDNALRILFDRGEPITVEAVKAILEENEGHDKYWYQNISIKEVDLSVFDQLLSSPVLSDPSSPHLGEMNHE